MEWCSILSYGHQQPSVGGDVREKNPQIVHQSYKTLSTVVI